MKPTLSRRRVPAAGHKRRDRRGQVLLNVGFDEELFDAIRAHALKSGVSLTEQVRTYCEWGIDTEDEAAGGGHQ